MERGSYDSSTASGDGRALLNAGEILFVADRIRSVEHDWFALEPVIGSARLHQGYLYFYDGVALYLSDLCLSPGDGLASAIGDICQRHRPRRIELTLANGEQHLDILAANGFKRVWFSGEDGHNWEVVLPFSGIALERFEQKANEVRRRNKLFHLSLHRGPLSQSHRSLLTRYIENLEDELTAFDRRSIEMLPDFLAQSDFGITLNAAYGDRLLGFAQGHLRHRPRLGIFSFCVAPGRVSQLSDCLYVVFLDEIRRRGAEACSLGVTMWPGLYRYKTKWGAAPLAGPYRYETWEAG